MREDMVAVAGKPRQPRPRRHRLRHARAFAAACGPARPAARGQGAGARARKELIMAGELRSKRLLENRDRLATALVRQELLKACCITPEELEGR